MRPLLALFLFAFALSARAAELPPGYEIQCFEDPSSLKEFCFVPSKLTANGDLRASPLYLGTRKDIDATKFILVAECKSSRVTLRAAKGATGKIPAVDARLGKALANDMCAVKDPPVDKTLRPVAKPDRVVASSRN